MQAGSRGSQVFEEEETLFSENYISDYSAEVIGHMRQSAPALQREFRL
jgi:hypothetical protein